jgi:hypothetical protein
LSDDGSNVFAFSIAIRPDHEMRRPSRLGLQIRLNAAVVVVLQNET